ncbi:MAG TPA: redox-sensing transcriptional repressor Rex [Ignavibacteria bacterium]|nr:redox-sensing transcriptional repressor Rex [Ignavibacteria bacterium]
MNDIKSAPAPTLKRLPKYLHLLEIMKSNGVEKVSSMDIAKELEFDTVQVRKDIACTGIIGKPRIGYDIDTLIQSIVSFLNWDNISNAVLVGAGNLGSALMHSSEIEKCGLKIIAAFDSDKRKVNKKVFGIEVFDIEKLVDLAYRMRIHIGIITVPSKSAQEVAELMILAGIKAIWNFAPAQLKVPEKIYVENTHFASNISQIKRRLKENLSKENIIINQNL